MRLRGQTAKIQGGFVLFPRGAPWLDRYELKLTSFPNSKYDDQADSTVNALAWFGEQQTSSYANAVEWLRLTNRSGQCPTAAAAAHSQSPGKAFAAGT